MRQYNSGDVPGYTCGVECEVVGQDARFPGVLRCNGGSETALPPAVVNRVDVVARIRKKSANGGV